MHMHLAKNNVSIIEPLTQGPTLATFMHGLSYYILTVVVNGVSYGWNDFTSVVAGYIADVCLLFNTHLGVKTNNHRHSANFSIVKIEFPLESVTLRLSNINVFYLTWMYFEYQERKIRVIFKL